MITYWFDCCGIKDKLSTIFYDVEKNKYYTDDVKTVNGDIVNLIRLVWGYRYCNEGRGWIMYWQEGV